MLHHAASAAEVALARHQSGIVIPNTEMCWDHDPGTQKTVTIHWDPSKKQTIPGDPKFPYELLT